MRETERRARARRARRPSAGAAADEVANMRDLEERLTRKLGTRVDVADRKGKGHVNIAFSSYDELDRLLEMLYSLSLARASGRPDPSAGVRCRASRAQVLSSASAQRAPSGTRFVRADAARHG